MVVPCIKSLTCAAMTPAAAGATHSEGHPEILLSSEIIQQTFVETYVKLGPQLLQRRRNAEIDERRDNNKEVVPYVNGRDSPVLSPTCSEKRRMLEMLMKYNSLMKVDTLYGEHNASEERAYTDDDDDGEVEPR